MTSAKCNRTGESKYLPPLSRKRKYGQDVNFIVISCFDPHVGQDRSSTTLLSSAATLISLLVLYCLVMIFTTHRCHLSIWNSWAASDYHSLSSSHDHHLQARGAISATSSSRKEEYAERLWLSISAPLMLYTTVV